MDNYKIYLNSISKYPTYGDEESTRLVETIEERRLNLTHGNLRLVAKIAFEHAQLWQDFDVMDFIQEGNLALMRCVKFYKPERGSFTTYVGFSVRGAIMRFIKENTGSLRLFKTKGQRQVFNNMTAIRNKYLECGASLEELASEFDTTPADLELIFGSFQPVELDNLLSQSPEDELVQLEEVKILKDKIEAFRHTLSLPQLAVFDGSMYTGTRSLKEIGDEMGTNRKAVWMIKQRVMKKALDFFDLDDLKRIQVGDISYGLGG